MKQTFMVMMGVIFGVTGCAPVARTVIDTGICPIHGPCKPGMIRLPHGLGEPQIVPAVHPPPQRRPFEPL